jgi:signal transduction histidine kinase
VERSHGLARAGLTVARRAIGTLRDDVLPGPDRLPELGETFKANTDVYLSLNITGDPRPLGADADLAVYRVAQEALTNITKHASPDRVRVSLDYEQDQTRLRVEDYAKGKEPVNASTDDSAGAVPRGPFGQPGGGHGLGGMRERAKLLGGDLVAIHTSHGFLVELRIPK